MKLNDACKTFNELQKNGEQGCHFHSQLIEHIEKLIQMVNEYIMKRTREKTELLNRINMQSFGGAAQPNIYGAAPRGYSYPNAPSGYPSNIPQTYPPASVPSYYSGAPQGYYQGQQGQVYGSGRPQNQPQNYPDASQWPNYAATGRGYPGAPGGPSYPGTTGYGHQQPRPGYPPGYGY